MDTIKIKNLEIFSNHGVLKEENVLGQKFLISADLTLSTRNAGTTDNLELSVNYAEICHDIKQIMENNTFRLIETAAEKICEELLKKYSLISKISLEVKKPWAPILLPLEYVSVNIERQWHKVYLSLGSNMGDRENYLNTAIEYLKKQDSCRNITVSDFIETEPYGMTEQDSFINCCAELETLLTPHELLELTSSAEQNAKRERLIHWGPRTLDIDIILYDDLIIHDSRLIIPHIDMANREFVLKPLVQLNPYAMNPVLKKSAADMLADLQKS
ncbi:MAG: 2-amino-4-hydroxy-6-hydroxymethyldihydropteridine diphosphokinase [Oscillospiraceae bacterium]|nr:2-amino-4-hydroxy-6-hydroxymethyldihydropteridine diphosphokinase [Oscillospiraceae bacterium]